MYMSSNLVVRYRFLSDIINLHLNNELWNILRTQFEFTILSMSESKSMTLR